TAADPTSTSTATTLETLPVGDDIVLGGRIHAGADGVLQSTIALGQGGNPLDVLSGGQILPGQDGMIHSVVAPGSDDQLVDQAIYPGIDGVCQSEAALTDTQAMNVDDPICYEPDTPDPFDT